MSTQIFNGGLELGILEIVGYDNLSEADQARYDYLDALPKNRWVNLDENGKMISREEAMEKEREKLKRYGIKKREE